MWKIFKSLPRALRIQYNGPARSSPVGTISAEEEEGTRLNCALINNLPIVHTNSLPCIETDNSSKDSDRKCPGGDQEWKRSFKNYCDFTKKLYLLESLSLGTAIALGVNLVNYHQLLVNKDNDVNLETNARKQSVLSCLLRVAFSMPKTINRVLPEQQTHKENKVDGEQEQQNAVAKKAFEEACESFMALVNTYKGVSKNVSAIDKTRKGLHTDAIKDWQEASSSGYSKADYNLGVSYELGKGTRRNFARAAQHYKMAASAGHSKAQYNLALMIMSGRHQVSDDSYSAVQLLELAASQGLRQAQTYLGMLYTSSENKDYAKAVSMFEAAAEQKDANAQFQLGVCYEQGLGVELNECKAAELFSKAASSGHAKAMYNLGVFYENGFGGIPENTQHAKELYRKAADKGVVNAKYNLHRLEAIEAVNELAIREKTSSHKLQSAKSLETRNGMHVSLSSPNLMLQSKPDLNMNNTATEMTVKEKAKKRVVKFNLGGDEKGYGNLFDLNFGNFGTGTFGSFVLPKKDMSSSTCSLEEATIGQNQLDSDCIVF